MYGRVGSNFLMYLSFIFCTFFFLYVFAPTTLHAQSFLGGSQGISLVANPRFPSANTDVQISLDDYQFNTAGASISWFVDSVEQTAFRNDRSITITTGSLGKKSVVSVVLTRANAPQLTTSITLVPTEVHIILEADTYIPNFYKGRALPSTESTVRAIAIVQDGTKSLPGAYTYRWSEESTVLFGGPIKGKYAYAFTMPRYGSKRLSVDVINAEGNAIGSGAIMLKATPPELLFYEQSPLRGLREKTVSSPHPFIGEETTIHGEPFFLNASMRTGDATFRWKINSLETTSGETSPNAITLKRVGDSGKSQVTLEIITKTHIPQLITGAFDLVF